MKLFAGIKGTPLGEVPFYQHLSCIFEVSDYTFLPILITHKQQYQLFPLPVVGLTGLKSGTGEPVLGHKDFENVSLVVNDVCVG